MTVLLAVCCLASPAFGASLEKAKAFYQNNLLDEAKRELIEVLYADDSGDAERSRALYMLGLINEKQGHTELAESNWRDLMAKYPQSAEAPLARENLNHGEVTPGKQATAPPSKPVGDPAPGLLDVHQGTAADLSRPVRTEVPNPMVIQAIVPAMKAGIRDKTLTLQIRGTDLYVCDKAHVAQLTVSRRPRPLGGDPREAMLDDVNVWPRGAAMVYIVAPTISTDYFRQDIDLTITATTKGGEVLATRTWKNLTIGSDNTASKLGLWGASSTKTPKLIVPVSEAQIERFEAEPILLKITIEIQE
jgi:hypothetical protein